MIPDTITPDHRIRLQIEAKSSAGSNMCWTCGTCDFECPVYISTERLNPQKIIRMANFGLLESLLDLPDIWYCQMCRCCHKGCPNAVKPYEVIDFARREAMQRSVVNPSIQPLHRELLTRFQRVRWRTAQVCMHGELTELTQAQWQQWLQEPVPPPTETITANHSLSAENREGGLPGSESQACYTCSECSGCCPIFSSRPVFDPQYIIRMVNCGLTDEMLHSPSIWLCLRCELCGAACSQKVRGYKVIGDLQELALETGVVDPGFPERLFRAERVIYPRFIQAIDQLLETYRKT